MSQKKVLNTVFLLAPFVFGFAFAMDVYIPVVPQMKEFFHTSQANIQLSLSLFMFVLGVGQLLMGPVTDQWGRRPVIIAGVTMFTLGSLICALANSIDVLLIGRVIEAFGACGMMVVAFAIVRDKFSGNDGAKVYSFLNCGLAMSPLFAPIIGSYLASWFSWRSEFFFLTVMGVAIVVLAFCRISETLVPEQRTKIDRGLFLRYWQILTNRTFASYAFCTTAGLTIFFTFFSSSPYIIIQLLHVPVRDFGYYFFMTGLAFFVGSMISGKAAERLGAFKVSLLGSIIMLVAGIVMMAWYLVLGLSITAFILPMMMAGIGGALMMGAGAGGAMEPFAKTAGAAAALVGCLQFLISSTVGTYIMTWQVNSTVPLAITMIALSALAIVVLGCLGKRPITKLGHAQFD